VVREQICRGGFYPRFYGSGYPVEGPPLFRASAQKIRKKILHKI